MKLLTKELEHKLPALGSQDEVTDPMVHVKFFNPMGSWQWFAIEYDPETRTFFGFVHGFEDELGYFTLTELEGIMVEFGLGIERDRYWAPRPLSEVKDAIAKYGRA